MQIPSVVSHFLVALPRKAVREMTRGIQNKVNNARLDKRFRYQRMDSDKGVLHRHASQYAGKRQGTSAEEQTGQLRQTPGLSASMRVNTGVLPPVRRLFEVTNQRLLEAPSLKKSALILQGDIDPRKAPANLPDVIPSADAGHADNHAEVRTRFMRQIRHARRELLNNRRSLLTETMGKEGRVLKEAVLRCEREYERQYSLEFGAFFLQRVGKEISAAESIKTTLREAHDHAADHALLHLSLSKNPDMQNYKKFLSRFGMTFVKRDQIRQKIPSVPPRTGVVAYQPDVPAQISAGEAGQSDAGS